MVFLDILKDLVEGVPGAAAALVMGYDGIPLDQYVGNQGASFDLQTLGVEYCAVINDIKKNAASLGTHGVSEINVRTEQWTLLIRMINEEYFAMMALNSNAYFGKGRYLLRNAVTQVRSQL